jgi:deazaflavin-dependent oxidoreductase (nitroreductase family)
MKRRIVTWFQRHFVNPVALRIARFVPSGAIIETVVRRSGQPRLTPVGGRLEGSTLWVVTEFGMQSNYVRNIAAHPQVRVCLKGRWLTGIALILVDDDARARLRQLSLVNSFLVRLVGTELLTLRIDLNM